jgi:hypothetical protein
VKNVHSCFQDVCLFWFKIAEIAIPGFQIWGKIPTNLAFSLWKKKNGHIWVTREAKWQIWVSSGSFGFEKWPVANLGWPKCACGSNGLPKYSTENNGSFGTEWAVLGICFAQICQSGRYGHMAEMGYYNNNARTTRRITRVCHEDQLEMKLPPTN